MPMLLAWNFLKAATLSNNPDWTFPPPMDYPTEPGQTTLGQFDWRGMFQNPGPFISPSGRPEEYRQRQEELAQQHREGMKPLMPAFNPMTKNKTIYHGDWANKVNNLSTILSDEGLISSGYPKNITEAEEIHEAANKMINEHMNYADGDIPYQLSELHRLTSQRHHVDFGGTPDSVQTELGNFLGFPSRHDDPISMIRVESPRRRGQNKLYDAFKEGIVPYQQDTGYGDENYQGFERNTGRPFPLLEKPGVFATAANLSDIGNITTGGILGDKPLVWGIRQNPKDIDAFMREPKFAPEDLNEIFIRDKIDPSRLVSLPTFGDPHWGNIRRELSRYASYHTPPLRAALNAEGKPITFDIHNANLTDEELNILQNDTYFSQLGDNIDVLDRNLSYLPSSIKDKLWESLEKQGYPKDLLYRWKDNEHGSKLSRLAHDWAVKSGLPRFATSDIDFPTNEHHWPVHPNGSPFTIEEISINKNALKDATQYMRELHEKRRPPEFGEFGEEFTTQPPSSEERDRWNQKWLLDEDEYYALGRGGEKEGGAFAGSSGEYSPEFWEKIRRLRELDKKEGI